MGAYGVIPNALIGGSSAVLLLVFMFGFGGTDYFYDVAIYIGMGLDPADGVVKVWAHIPHPAIIETRMFGFRKFDPETNQTEDVGLMDLFPTGDDANEGYGSATFGIELNSDSDHPPLNMTQGFIPMVWAVEKEVGRIQTLIFVIAAFSLNNWLLVKWTMILGMVIGLAGAVGLQVKRQKADENVEFVTS